MPDFTFKQNFPIASVIEAAQRKAALEQQNRTEGNQQLLAGLKSIGDVGQNLVDKRMKVAQALALGKQFDIPEDQARLMTPEQIVQTGNIKKSNINMRSLLLSMHPELANNSQFMASFGSNATAGQGATQAPTTPTGEGSAASTRRTLGRNSFVKNYGPDTGNKLADYLDANPGSNETDQEIYSKILGNSSPASAVAPQDNGAILASNSTVDPLQVQNAPASVPIQVPPTMPGMVNKATADMIMKTYLANKPEPVMSKEAALSAGSVPHGTKIVEPTGTNTDKKEQDAYWRDAVRGLQSIRGDTAMKDIEAQRTAATTAYNRLKDIEYSGKVPNPIDYIDILGQVYKARTGTAPTQEVLKEAKQNTSTAALGKFWTFATGKQMPGTSKDIAASLKDMVGHMGLQADELHDGYMQVHGHEVFNPNMTEENVKKLSKLSRGKSFVDATGVKPEDFDVHLQAIKWAQANPNDPRSAPILQKALQEKSALGGGSIGL